MCRPRARRSFSSSTSPSTIIFASRSKSVLRPQWTNCRRQKQAKAANSATPPSPGRDLSIASDLSLQGEATFCHLT
ncbi:protein of unknown function [Hyphomicrobium sp. 1Nfss2.1]